jgi:NADH dehydrogenase
MKVALFGSTGFVGGYLVRALLEAGHEPCVLVRPGSETRLVESGRCRVTSGDIADGQAIEATLQDCDAAIYNIGILKAFPRRGITFEALHFDGACRVIDAAKRLGTRRFLMMSANGVKSPGTPYQDTKFRADEYLASSGLDWTIFRPSVIFGDSRGMQEISNQLYNELVRPPVPAPAFHNGVSPGGNGVVMSPVCIHDVADAFVATLRNSETIGKTYELGGPEVLTWEDMVRRVAEGAGRKKIVLPMPIGLMKFAATLFDWLPFFPATRDQLTMLAEGNVADPAALELLIGRPAAAFSAENLSYLRNRDY